MLKRRFVNAVPGLAGAALAAVLAGAGQTCACGGLFSPDMLVDQNAERIIFVDNGDGTLTSIIQIDYLGSAEDFAWVLPVPPSLQADDVLVLEDGRATFNALELATDPVFIKPEAPSCFSLAMGGGAVAGEGVGAVDIYGSGSVGPYAFDIIGSDDPGVLFDWLGDNGYPVTPEIEPLIGVYIEGGMAFLAMRLLPGEAASSIEPVQVTFPAQNPMIPLQMAAVAAVPDTRILVWFFGAAPAAPVNYARAQVPDDRLIFYERGGNNYRALLSEQVDMAGGQAFVTEYAGPTRAFQFTDPLLQELAAGHPYLTRLSTVISPEEMTVDPAFLFDPAEPEVSQVHDLTYRGGDAWEMDCVTVRQVRQTAMAAAVAVGAVCLLVLASAGLIAALIARRRRSAAG